MARSQQTIAQQPSPHLRRDLCVEIENEADKEELTKTKGSSMHLHDGKWIKNLAAFQNKIIYDCEAPMLLASASLLDDESDPSYASLLDKI